MDNNQALTAFAALSQETRLDALRLLVAAGPKGLAAGEIAKRLAVRQNTMSTNLAILDRAGLVTSRREGRSVRYLASLESLRDVVEFLMEDCCGGQPELCAPLLDEVLGTACPPGTVIGPGTMAGRLAGGDRRAGVHKAIQGDEA